MLVNRSMNLIHTQYYPTALGELLLGSLDGKLCLCDWRYRKARDSVDRRLQSKLKAQYLEKPDEVIDHAIAQLEEYFSQQREVFEVPLLLAGTDFQKAVWGQLQQIPFGQTASYLQLAERMNNPKAVRAVASANGANALSIFVPCHRIVGSNGELVGYAGGLETKRKLLGLEGDLFA